MVGPSVLVVLPLMLATLIVTANTQSNTAPVPSPLPDAADSPSSSSPPPPPPPEPSSSTAPPPYSSTPSPPAASSWTPVVNVNDPNIVQVAQFAVHIYGLSMTTKVHMQLLSVVSGETQPSSDGGCNYRLIITVSGGQNTQYEASVWGILGTSSWKLWSFTPIY